MTLFLGTLAGSPNPAGAARQGSSIAEWADSPEKLALVWIVGIAVLVAVLVLVIKFKRDRG